MKIIISIYENLSEMYINKNQLNMTTQYQKETLSLIKLLVKKYITKENVEKQFEFSKKMIQIFEENERYDEAIRYTNRQISFIKKYKKILFKNDKKEYTDMLLSLYANLGWDYNRNGNFEQSVKLYKKAIKLNPKKDYLYRNIAITYRDNKQYDIAINMHKKSIEIDNGNSDNYAYLANTYAKKGNILEAIKMYKEALKKNSKYAFGYLNIFEIQVANNISFDKKLEKEFLSLFKDRRDRYVYYEMMKIFKNIVNKKEINLENWSKKYSDIELGWDFSLTDKWIGTIQDKDIKERLLEATRVFKKQNK
jgi:tetratricopeptide (TPR) repeat protein